MVIYVTKQQARALELFGNGMAVKDIALTLGVSYQRVVNILNLNYVHNQKLVRTNNIRLSVCRKYLLYACDIKLWDSVLMYYGIRQEKMV